MMLVVENLQNSIRSGKNSSLGGIRRSVVDYSTTEPRIPPNREFSPQIIISSKLFNRQCH
jgi:hypothetical protein